VRLFPLPITIESSYFLEYDPAPLTLTVPILFPPTKVIAGPVNTVASGSNTEVKLRFCGSFEVPPLTVQFFHIPNFVRPVPGSSVEKVISFM